MNKRTFAWLAILGILLIGLVLFPSASDTGVSGRLTWAEFVDYFTPKISISTCGHDYPVCDGTCPDEQSCFTGPGGCFCHTMHCNQVFRYNNDCTKGFCPTGNCTLYTNPDYPGYGYCGCKQ